MRAKVREQEEARRLRHEGWPLRRIAVELGVSIASVSVWVRDIPTGGTRARRTVRWVRLPVISGQLRRCGKCERRLPLELFNRHPKYGRQYWCRECFRSYFRARGSRHLEQVEQARAARRRKARDHVLRILQRSSCLDCGESDPIVLDFDHVHGKKLTTISNLVWRGHSISAIDREIAKCEIVCANCHRRRTGIRQGSWRAMASSQNGTIEAARPLQLRNLLFIKGVLELSGCVDCGVRDLLVLEFDHVGEKMFPISRAVWKEYSIARIRKELEQCAVCCANCHRRRTARRRRQFRHHASAPVAQRSERWIFTPGVAGSTPAGGI
jgi:5-methylcytosine-specific restriction endonuclease McrA